MKSMVSVPYMSSLSVYCYVETPLGGGRSPRAGGGGGGTQSRGHPWN